MKITRRAPNDLPGLSDLAPPAGSATQESEAADQPGRQPARDRVELSAEARLRARLRQEITEVPAGVTDKVAALRAEVEAGRYRPDPLEIADRLLRDLAVDLLV